jgi:uncharacterized membrane protein YhaH (DUF805 family)
MYRAFPWGLSWTLAFKPFRDMFVFKGRSTRSEVLSFWLLGTVTGFVNISMNWGLPGVNNAFETFFLLFWTFPWIALAVRRLHDQGRSAWWLLAFTVMPLAVLAFLATGLMIPGSAESGMKLAFFDWRLSPAPGLPTVVLTVIALVSSAVILALWLWNDTPGPNRFGPDPREQLAAA